MKFFFIINLLLICSLSFSQFEKDSIYFSYSDYNTYKILNSGLNFNSNDSLSQFHLTGNNSKTYYDKYSKNDFSIDGNFSILHSEYKYGFLLSTDHISNSSLTRPTSNDIRIMPLIGYIIHNLNMEIALGFIAKTDEVTENQGQGLSIKGNYNLNDRFNNFNLNTDLLADNLNDDYNYNNNSRIEYIRLFEGDFGKFSTSGSNSTQQYHFSDIADNLFRINRYEYDVRSEFLYIASNKIQNISNISFFTRNKDSFKNNSLLSYNSYTDIGLTDEIIFSDSKMFSSLKFDFDTGSDKYSLDYEENDKSLSFYNFTIGSSSYYNLRQYKFGISGKYFKHEYKSLTNSNTEDRDIIKINLKPDISYSTNNNFSITQSFPLEYYRLINISALRSGSNYIDRVVNSITDIKNSFNENLYVAGNIHLRSYFRSYDYDDTYSNCFIIKNYSLGDTVAYKITPKFSVKFSNQYIYEEYGNFNYSAFIENPLTYKDHYYTSISFLFGRSNGFFLNLEYYFYEIDSYNFDQDDFNKGDLTRVYISHGPKFGFSYTVNNFHLFSGLDIDNFRFEEKQIRFRIESYVTFN